MISAQLRTAPFWRSLLAVLVALAVLAAQGIGLLLLEVLTFLERFMAVVLVLVTWVDERASGHAGLPPLAATAGLPGGGRRV